MASKFPSDYIRTMAFSAEQATRYYEWNYATRLLLEDIKSSCSNGDEGPWLPETILERLEDSLRFWQIPD